MHKEIFTEKLNDSESKKLSNFPNYLILVEDKGKLDEIIPVCTITKVLEIIGKEGKSFTILEKTNDKWEIMLRYIEEM